MLKISRLIFIAIFVSGVMFFYGCSSNEPETTENNQTSTSPTPTVSILSPADGTITNEPSITITGTADISSPYTIAKVQVKINDEDWQDATGTTNWSKIINLTEGTNSIYARAIGSNSKTNTDEITLIYEPSMPTVSILSPADGTITNEPSITITGTADISSPYTIAKVQVKINDEDWQDATGTTNWSKDITLSEWTNSIYARAIGSNSKTNTTSELKVIYEPEPEITITSPNNGTETNEESITLTGTATIPAPHTIAKVQVKINDGDWQDATGTANWSKNLTLIGGTNIIYARAIGSDYKTNTTGEWEIIYNVPFIKVAGGENFSLGLKKDGTLWATGQNNYGQLGTGDTTDRHTWTLVLSNVVEIAAGYSHSLAVRNDGTLWVAGWNAFGQLGTGDTTDRHTWIQITALANVEKVAAGQYFSLAVKNDGTLWATGNNGYGQLGKGDTTSINTWTQISTINDVVQISAGESHSLAVKSDGTLWVTGRNNSGQLGTGNTADINTWTQISTGTISDVISVSAGKYHSIALKNDGTVWGTGYNETGQLGTGDAANKTTWTQISTINNVVRISVGENHSLAIKNDGTLWATGNNGNGRLGLGDTANRLQWTQVSTSTISDVSNIGAGCYHSLAVKNDGTLWTTGANDYGQLGTGDTTEKHTWTQVE